MKYEKKLKKYEIWRETSDKGCTNLYTENYKLLLEKNKCVWIKIKLELLLFFP